MLVHRFLISSIVIVGSGVASGAFASRFVPSVGGAKVTVCSVVPGAACVGDVGDGDR